MKPILQESKSPLFHENLVLAQNGDGEFLSKLGFLPYEEPLDVREIIQSDFRIACEVRKAEGTYQLEYGQLVWREPIDKNIYIDITVRSQVGEFIPCLNVYAVLVGPDGKVVIGKPFPYAWHPWMYHYGENFFLSTPGTYSLRLHIDRPADMFPQQPAFRFPEMLDVEFPALSIWKLDRPGF